MSITLIALTSPPPHGFTVNPHPTRIDLCRHPVCLVGPGARSILDKEAHRATGIAVEIGDQICWSTLGPHCLHLEVPTMLLAGLGDLITPVLELLERTRRSDERAGQEATEAERAIRDRSDLVKEHVEYRESLRRENTDRRRSELALRRSEEQYRELVEGTNCIILRCNSEGVITFINGYGVNFFGWSREELVGRPVFETIVPEKASDGSDLRQSLRRVFMDPQTSTSVLNENICHDGRRVWVSWSNRPVRDAQGAIVEMLSVGVDVTDRKHADELRVAYGEAENLLSILSALLVGVDDHDRIFRFNAAAERIFGVPASDVLGRTFSESGIRLEWGDVIPLMIAVAADGINREVHDLRCSRPDGIEAYVDLSIIPVHAPGTAGRRGVVLVGFDVTQRRQDEAQHAHGQKLESIGQLAAGIAHEINTPIQFIGDNLQFLASAFVGLSAVAQAAQSSTANDEPSIMSKVMIETDAEYLATEVPRAIEQSREGIQRVTSIVQALKEFSHPDGYSKESIDINASIRTTLIVARNEYKYVADVVMHLADGLPPILGLGGGIHQVFLNLIINAAQAIASKEQGGNHKGKITISTNRADQYVEIRIADTGTGIRPEHQNRLFTPFFTTKPIGKGTGQGLALCHAIIVKRHNGSIAYESEFGTGATAIVRLPIADNGIGSLRP